MKRKVQLRIFSLMSTVVLVLCGSLTAHAQAAGPTLSDHIARLSIRASQLLPYLQYEVLSRIQDWVHGIAVALAIVVLLFGFLRLWRENSGGNSNLIFYFLPLVILLWVGRIKRLAHRADGRHGKGDCRGQ